MQVIFVGADLQRISGADLQPTESKIRRTRRTVRRELSAPVVSLGRHALDGLC